MNNERIFYIGCGPDGGVESMTIEAAMAEIDRMRELIAVVERWNDDGGIEDHAVHAAVEHYRRRATAPVLAVSVAASAATASAEPASGMRVASESPDPVVPTADLTDLDDPSQFTLLGSAMRASARLHADEDNPGFEYATTRGPLRDFDEHPPDGDGWERNTARGRDGWERFDDREEAYWCRRRT